MPMRHFWTTLALVTAAGACGSDSSNPTGPEALLQASWVATAWEYTSHTSPSQTVSFTAQGISVTLTVGESSYSIVFSAPGQPSQTISGTYTVSGNSFSFSNGNNTLTMSDPNTNWDFDDDGIDEPATLSMVFTRR
jgi:hypothetical protein